MTWRWRVEKAEQTTQQRYNESETSARLLQKIVSELLGEKAYLGH